MSCWETAGDILSETAVEQFDYSNSELGRKFAAISCRHEGDAITTRDRRLRARVVPFPGRD